jgi:hypothetical protein
MARTDDDVEIGGLSEVYDVLKDDAKTIITDLQGGVTMWREAAAANLAVAGFLFILALTTYHYGPSGVEGTLTIAFEIILAVVSLGFSAFGFRKYFRLRSRYQGLFERAKKLE